MTVMVEAEFALPWVGGRSSPGSWTEVVGLLKWKGDYKNDGGWAWIRVEDSRFVPLDSKNGGSEALIGTGYVVKTVLELMKYSGCHELIGKFYGASENELDGGDEVMWF